MLFRSPLKISDGQTLPTTTINEWIIVGQGSYLQSGGFPDVVCVEEINIVLSNGISWSLGFGIAIDGIDTSQFVKLTTNQTIDGVKTFVQSPIVPDATTANQAVNFGQINLQSVLDGGNSSTKGIIVETLESTGVAASGGSIGIDASGDYAGVYASGGSTGVAANSEGTGVAANGGSIGVDASGDNKIGRAHV